MAMSSSSAVTLLTDPLLGPGRGDRAPHKLPPSGDQPQSGTPALALDASIVIIRWDDHDLIGCGHDLRSDYVERFWLGVLGPATVLMLRRFARGFAERPDGFRVHPVDTAAALGLGRGTGKSSIIARTIDRACQFGAARIEGPDQLAVRSMLASLTDRQLARLPEPVRRAHDRWESHGR